MNGAAAAAGAGPGGAVGGGARAPFKPPKPLRPPARPAAESDLGRPPAGPASSLPAADPAPPPRTQVQREPGRWQPRPGPPLRAGPPLGAGPRPRAQGLQAPGERGAQSRVRTRVTSSGRPGACACVSLPPRLSSNSRTDDHPQPPPDPKPPSCSLGMKARPRTYDVA